MDDTGTSLRTGIVMPLRGFASAHMRLAGALTGTQRARLAEALATGVIRACRPHPVVVVTSDPDTRTWAHHHDALTIDDPGSLDAAATDGQAFWAARGLDRVVIVHADLATVDSLDAVITGASARETILVPCQRDDGTTVISIPADAPFAFSYGPGSFLRHRSLGAARVVLDADLRIDIDVPEDLAFLPPAIRATCGLPPTD